MFTFAHGFLNGTETLALHAATYNASTYLVGDEIVSGTPTFVHTEDIYALCSDGYYHSFGENKRVVKNGRYVSDSAVYADNGSGTLLDPLPMTVYQKSFTNVVTYSNNVSNWTDSSGNNNFVKDQISLAGVSNAIYRAIDDVSVAQYFESNTWTGAAGTLKFWLKKDATQTTGGQFYCSDGLNFSFTAKDGTYYDANSGDTTAIEVISDGDCYIYLIEVTSLVSFIEVNPCNKSLPLDGTSDFSLTGEIVLKNIEYHSGKTIDDVRDIGPIFTTTASETTDEIINTYPAANWSNSEGPIYLIYDYKGIDEVILLNDDVSILYVTSDILYLNDGTNTASIACSTEGEHEIGIVLDTVGNKMKLNLDGTYATEATYDNSFGTGNITVEANIREYKRRDESSYTAQQTILDGWMP